MIDPAAAAEGTVLTDRQVEVLARRRDGQTQTAIAEELGTTVANISAIERAGRDNVERARRTVALIHRLDAAAWFTADEGTHLRDLVEAVYDRGDDAAVRVTVSHPELSAFLRVRLEAHLDDRKLTESVDIGISHDGHVVTEPPVPPEQG